ncbi:AAA family ATPase [Agrobacterium sp. ST15.13.015]|uniref:AAA family ATPase n=1 Tax=Agrobacterium sp. ST15.13.015 TaxID=3017319 RepID=UPI0022C85231|nr:AAA family ATPase [Agrobacterium sp. ST15.13.015]MCZ7502761.1 AAA family ATPase [Rhizobium rhizogenes]
MLKTIHIENYKSIKNLTLELGRVNVFIGENGAGKSNILEAIALAGAAQAGKLDNEFLASRGIRVTEPQFMRSAFEVDEVTKPISVRVVGDGGEASYELSNDNQPYSTWTESTGTLKLSADHFIKTLSELSKGGNKKLTSKLVTQILQGMNTNARHGAQSSRKGSVSFSLQLDDDDKSIFVLRPEIDGIANFIVYSPENSSLRVLEREGQIEPLGINGEGLLKLLTVMSYDDDTSAIETVKESLKLFSWFEDFEIPRENAKGRMKITDGYLDESCKSFDQRSANEGFLFAAFYFALFASKLTPNFFAVDNIDASLNPKLCEVMMKRLTKLAKDNDKQAILTTHNPSVLDGLNLNDPEQKLFAIHRNARGETRATQHTEKPSTDSPRRLSEMFIGGLLGGVPKVF